MTIHIPGLIVSGVVLAFCFLFGIFVGGMLYSSVKNDLLEEKIERVFRRIISLEERLPNIIRKELNHKAVEEMEGK